MVTRRTTINGHTGGRMSNAGDVVLFGGSVEPGETTADAALRELCEEAGTLHLLGDGELAVRERVGTWVTEAGHLVEGYLVDVPPSFIAAVAADVREVAEIAYLPLRDVRSATVSLEYHRVDPLDHALGDETEFESPTLRVRHPESGEEWVLWGLAGHMVDEWLRHS